MFTVPPEGHAAASSNGSPRVELKSADPPKDKWLPTDSTMHCLSQTMIVHSICPTEQQLTVSQMHGDMSDLIKVQFYGAGLRLLMPAPDHVKVTLEKTVGLGEKFSTDICVQDGKAMFYVNNELKYTSNKLDLKGVVSPGGKGYMVMHAGAYSPGPGSDTDKGVMELFALTIGNKPANGKWTNITIV